MPTDSAHVAWSLHASAPAHVRASIEWPSGVTDGRPPPTAARLPTERLHALFEQVAERSPALPWLAARQATAEARGGLALLLRSSPEVGTMLERAQRYWAVLSGSSHLEVRRTGGGAALIVHPSGLGRGSGHGLELFTHYALASLGSGIQEWTEAAPPLQLHLPRAPVGLEPPAGLTVLERPVAPQLVLPEGALATPLVTRDDRVHRYLEGELDHLLEELAGTVSVAIDEVLRAELPNRPGMAEVARRLGTSERTLRRRLDEEGTSFRERLDHVRELAARELVQTHPIREVAARLGYDEPRSFQRAFRRWTGLSPLEARGQALRRPDTVTSGKDS